MKPPPLPSEILQRVLRVARINGTSILIIAGAFALAAATVRDLTGAITGLLIAGAGAFELHGAGLLRAGEGRGSRWLVGSQLFLMIVILAYVSLRLDHPELANLRPLLTDENREAIRSMGMSTDEFLRLAYRLGNEALAAGTVIYQGCMALYYYRRRRPIQAALREEFQA